MAWAPRGRAGTSRDVLGVPSLGGPGTGLATQKTFLVMRPKSRSWQHLNNCVKVLVFGVIFPAETM